MSWASRRRALYLAGLLGALLLIVGVPAFFILYEAPRCDDGIQNGTEDGVDCGGECERVCSFSAAAPIVHWERIFEVIPGVYTVVARVENPNANVAAFDLPYTFKLREAGNILVLEEKGTFYLPPKSTVPVFLTGLQTGARIPTRVEFEHGVPDWIRSVDSPYPVSVVERQLEGWNTRPVLTATLRNTGTDPVPGFAPVAILYDAEGNALHASRTVVGGIEPLSSVDILFTWPTPFESPVAQIEIIPVFEQNER